MIYTIYSLGCVVFPCMLYQGYRLLCYRNSGSLFRIRHFIWTYIFLIYIWMVFTATGIGTLSDIGRYPELIRVQEINLKLFDTAGSISYILNIFMFVPLGFMLPYIFRSFRSVWKVVITGALFSLMIELSQLFNHRATDVDDLLNNTMGTLIGYCIWIIIVKFIMKKDYSGQLGKYEGAVYLFMAFAGQVILYNPYKIM